MNVVSFGGGTNSAAMIIGMYLREIPIDLILFADTGGERRLLRLLEKFDAWLTARGLPEVTFVQYHTKDGRRLTLEQECLKSGNLPSIAYGFKKCSLKHKIGTQEKFATMTSGARRSGRPAGRWTSISATTPEKPAGFNTLCRPMKRTRSTRTTIPCIPGAGPAKSASA